MISVIYNDVSVISAKRVGISRLYEEASVSEGIGVAVVSEGVGIAVVSEGVGVTVVSEGVGVAAVE